MGSLAPVRILRVKEFRYRPNMIRIFPKVYRREMPFPPRGDHKGRPVTGERSGRLKIGPERNVRRASSPHAVLLLRGSDYARSLTFTHRGLEVLAERKPAHDFLSGEAEA